MSSAKELHHEYKRLDRIIFSLLDPSGSLRGVNLSRAKMIVSSLVTDLGKDSRARVSDKLQEAISLRSQCADLYKLAPARSKRGHEIYIQFLEDIQQKLSVLGGKEAVLDTKNEQLEEQGMANDDETDLSPDQADFLAFLDTLMALTREAAALWKEVADGKLPIWTASTLTNILLQQVESFICERRLLNEEDWREDETSRVWATKSQPQLTQVWVDALDKVNDAGETWRELATLLPEIWDCVYSYLWPSLSAAVSVVNTSGQPRAFEMLRHGLQEVSGDGLKSVAQIPLVTLVAAYFCRLVMKDVDGMSKLVDLEAAREAACAQMKENLAILPRLCREGAVTAEDMNKFREKALQMMNWAKDCSEPMSLGAIHAFARVHWIYWYVRIIGSNSVPLQIFLYLFEKRRLERSRDQTDANIEGLIGALLEDQRVAPHLLMAGRPHTAFQCTVALRRWCHLPALGSGVEVQTTEMKKMMKATERSAQLRNTPLLTQDIENNNSCVTKDMYERLLKKPKDDIIGLRSYLSWELDAPSCLQLETALLKAVQKTSKWEDLLVDTVLGVVRAKTTWRASLCDVIKSGLQSLPELQILCVMITVEESLEIAVIWAALNTSGFEESLKTALTRAVCGTPGWQDSFIDILLGTTMSGWQRVSQKFDIKRLSVSNRVNSLACMEYLARNGLGDPLLQSFMDEARPMLEKAYGNGMRILKKRGP